MWVHLAWAWRARSTAARKRCSSLLGRSLVTLCIGNIRGGKGRVSSIGKQEEREDRQDTAAAKPTSADDASGALLLLHTHATRQQGANPPRLQTSKNDKQKETPRGAHTSYIQHTRTLLAWTLNTLSACRGCGAPGKPPTSSAAAGDRVCASKRSVAKIFSFDERGAGLEPLARG